MPRSSSSARAPRATGGQVKRNHSGAGAAAVVRKAPASPITAAQFRINIVIPNSSDVDDELDGDAPPAKRPKLSIRNKHATVDGQDALASASQSGAQTKPLTDLGVARPNGHFLEAQSNGVRALLDGDEDDGLSRSPSTNGLGRSLQRAPSGPDAARKKAKDKRTLRSHDDGPKLKSELATYFPNYEDIIFDAPKEEEFITLDTLIYVTDDAPKHTQVAFTQTSPHIPKGKGILIDPANAVINGATATSSPHKGNAGPYNGSSPVDLDVIARTLPDIPDDPLTDAHFFKSHRRAERKEKQLRNIERERAMHEKVQLERLLEGLQGHDWLKVLGITGITDGEARKFESKRDYFIEEVKFLVDKFKLWKEQEKRQRVEREEAARREVQESEERETEDGSVEPPSSDLNAGASRQLQQEALRASTTSQPSKMHQPLSSSKATQFLPPSPEAPFTSFYAKRHLRDAAVGKARHGRNITAFGHPVPDMMDREFELPPDYLSEDVLRANAREKRRRKRESIADAASGETL